MAKSRGRAGPSDPQSILARRVANLGAERHLDVRDPANWGVSVSNLTALPSAADVEVTVNDRSEVLAARRSDPYDLLHAAGGLSDDQHRASRRLFRDMALAAGLPLERAFELPILEKIDFGRGDAGAPTQAAIDASKRVKSAMLGIGPVHAQLLRALNESMIAGEIRPWRAIVQRVTGETHTNVHGAMVRQACEGLVVVYRGIDERRRAAAAEGQPAQMRPFSAFGPPASPET